jgi:hypothetical protein
LQLSRLHSDDKIGHGTLSAQLYAGTVDLSRIGKALIQEVQQELLKAPAVRRFRPVTSRSERAITVEQKFM